MSGLANDMSGGTKGYCLYWTEERAKVSVVDFAYSCESYTRGEPGLFSHGAKLARVLLLRIRRKWNW